MDVVTRGWAILTFGLCGCFGGPPAHPPAALRCDVSGEMGCFLPIEPTTFAMGAQSTGPATPGYDPAAQPDEAPVHTVTVDRFWIQAWEVTATAVRECVQAGRCEQVDIRGGVGAHLKHHAAGVTWHQADAYCRWLGGHLPTEAQWEVAARGASSTRYPWGDDPPCGLGTEINPFVSHTGDQMERYPGCDPYRPRNPRTPSGFGVHDLAWGHAEWVADWYGPYSSEDVSNPVGPKEGTTKGVRGGSWTALDPTEVRSAARSSLPPGTALYDVGFRCAW